MPGSNGTPGGLWLFRGCRERRQEKPASIRKGAGGDSAISSAENDEPEHFRDRREPWKAYVSGRPAARRTRRDFQIVRGGESETGDRQNFSDGRRGLGAQIHPGTKKHWQGDTERQVDRGALLAGGQLRFGEERFVYLGIDSDVLHHGIK